MRPENIKPETRLRLIRKHADCEEGTVGEATGFRTDAGIELNVGVADGCPVLIMPPWEKVELVKDDESPIE